MLSDIVCVCVLQGRYSFVGARPALEVLAKEQEVTVIDHMAGTRTVTTEADPLAVPQRIGVRHTSGGCSDAAQMLPCPVPAGCVQPGAGS